MNNVINDPEPAERSITWQAQRHPSHCDHQYEVIAHEVGGALKRCLKCRSLEAE